MISINGYEIENTRFPNGELKINVDNILESSRLYISPTQNEWGFVDKHTHNIRYKYRGDESLIELYLTFKALKDIEPYGITCIIFEYLPYSRMDRQHEKGEFSLKYITQWINTWGADEITVYEAHSDVSLALLDNSNDIDVSVQLARRLMNEIKFTKDDILFFPDAGAQKRYSNVLAHPHLVGIKNRDWKTGNISGLSVAGDMPNKPFRAIIVDDLSSFGGTFLHSARKLKELGATDIYLIVAHCEDSILKGELINSGLLKKIVTTNSIFTGSHHLIEVL